MFNLRWGLGMDLCSSDVSIHAQLKLVLIWWLMCSSFALPAALLRFCTYSSPVAFATGRSLFACLLHTFCNAELSCLANHLSPKRFESGPIGFRYLLAMQSQTACSWKNLAESTRYRWDHAERIRKEERDLQFCLMLRS